MIIEVYNDIYIYIYIYIYNLELRSIINELKFKKRIY